MNVKYTLCVRKRDIDDFIFPLLLMLFQFQTLQQYLSEKKNTLQHYSTEKSNKLQQKQRWNASLYHICTNRINHLYITVKGPSYDRG